MKAPLFYMGAQSRDKVSQLYLWKISTAREHSPTRRPSTTKRTPSAARHSIQSWERQEASRAHTKRALPPPIPSQNCTQNDPSNDVFLMFFSDVTGRPIN